MRRAIIHIGLPRTGTTSFQRVLSHLRPALAHAGILYPDLTPRSATVPHLSHQYFGEALDGRRKRPEIAELLASLAAQVAAAQPDTLILSYESLCLVRPLLGVPALLRRFLTQLGFAMEVLVTVKPPGEYLNSHYTWRTQFLLEPRPFAGFVRANLGMRRLDLPGVLAQWRPACDDRIRAVSTRDRRSHEPMVERIFAELGLLPRVAVLLDADIVAVADNRSPGPVAVEVARRLRRSGAHVSLGRQARTATFFTEEQARLRGVNLVSFRGLDAGLRAQVDERWDRANQAFAQMVWGQPWEARVVAEPERPVNEIARLGSDAGLEDAVSEIVAAACAKFDIPAGRSAVIAIRSAAAGLGAELGRAVNYGRALAGAIGRPIVAGKR
ncbi:hypothetical protein [Acidisphaera sp. L21]|uniref:hypothetical protein n=1 Tax=Acidisphaera sp. L21 TaxID=1641851 RepID=UPI00131ADCB0|nr:hypothetical protein [Acidisphaera sp. L21]